MGRAGVLVACSVVVTLALSLYSAFSVSGQCVNIPPVAIFTYSPAHPYTHEAVFFNGSDSYDPNGFIFSYSWNFGDGNVTAISNSEIVHVYADPDEYDVSLLVTDSLGATNSTEKTLLVSAHVLASFSYSPTDPHVRGLVTFDASNSTAFTGIIVGYAWGFGDGNRSEVGSPFITHSYIQAGEYTVTLNVTSGEGYWDVESRVVNVTAPSTVGPVAAFTWLPAVPQVGQLVEFNASSSTPGDGNITSYAWDFGDGTTQTDAQPIGTHTYGDFGNYIVSLNVTNSGGFSGVVNHSVTVVAKPVADFFFNPAPPRVCAAVTFNASVSDPRGGSIVSFQWIFGDNQTVQFGAVVTYRFRKMGEYVVSLNVTDSEGLWDVKNVTVTVRPHIADLNEDGVVNILDLTIFAKAYGSSPGDERWDPRADLDGNNIVNILDGVAIGRSYNMCADPFDP